MHEPRGAEGPYASYTCTKKFSGRTCYYATPMVSNIFSDHHTQTLTESRDYLTTPDSEGSRSYCSPAS